MPACYLGTSAMPIARRGMKVVATPAPSRGEPGQRHRPRSEAPHQAGAEAEREHGRAERLGQEGEARLGRAEAEHPLQVPACR